MCKTACGILPKLGLAICREKLRCKCRMNIPASDSLEVLLHMPLLDAEYATASTNDPLLFRP